MIIPVSNVVWAQVFEDSFSDSSFSEGVIWWGDRQRFQHEKKEGNHVIQSKGNERSELRIWSKISSQENWETSSNGSNYWEGYFLIEGASPSRQNQLMIMLSIHPTDAVGQHTSTDSLFHHEDWNGYGLLIGETGDDFVHLVRWDSSAHTILGTHPLLLQKGTGYHFRVEYNLNGQWNLRVEEGYPNTPEYLQQEGIELFDTRYPILGDRHYAGIFIVHTATRGHDFFIDFKIDPILPPSTPLLIGKTHFLSSKTLELYLNKAIRVQHDISTLFVLESRYDSVRYTSQKVYSSSPNSLSIEWDQSLPYHRYKLWHPILLSTSGDTLSNRFPHPVTLAEQPIPDSVHITEFLANPSAESGWPEYIELYNASDKTIDLTHSLLGDSKDLVVLDSVAVEDQSGSKSTSLRPLTLDPKSYLVFSRDPRALELLFPERQFVTFDLPYLNNGADELIWQSQAEITEGEVTIYDYLSYTSEWTDAERSIERIRLDLPSNDPRNWGPSQGEISSEGNYLYLPGTPGGINTVLRDTTRPVITALEFITPLRLELQFSERVQYESLELEFRDLKSYRLLDYDFSLESNVASSETHVLIHLMDELYPEQMILCKVIQARDWFKNTQSEQIITETYLPNDYPMPGDIVLNELLLQPNTKWPYEYIELYNRSSKYIQLQNWTLSDQSGNRWRIPDQHILFPKSFIVFNNVNTSIPSLNNTEDALILKATDGRTIDSVYYTKNWLEYDLHFAQSWDSSYSLERIHAFRSSNDPSNWRFNSTLEWGSPGGVNWASEFLPNHLSLPFAKLFEYNDGWYIETNFSSYLPHQPLTELYLESENQRFSLQLDMTETKEFRSDVFPHNHFIWQLNEQGLTESDLRNRDWILSVEQDILDELGNYQSIAPQRVCIDPSPQSLRFNEVMFDPLQDPMDHIPNGVEYLEIWNQDKNSTCLENLFIALEENEDGMRASQEFHNTRFKWVPPQEPLLLVASPNYITIDQHPIIKRHPIPHLEDSRVLILEGVHFGLNKGSDKRYLSHQHLGILDSLYYSEDWHNPNLYTTKGLSLERIDPYPSYTSAQNWTTSIDPTGGTPLQKNSVQQVASSKSTSNSEEFYFEPNPFSPDYDGFEDVSFLHYSWDYSNYLIRVWIYDRYGRLVNRLVRNAVGGNQGVIMWNGKNEHGKRVPIGRYIAYLEATDAHNGRIKRLKTTVVVAR